MKLRLQSNSIRLRLKRGEVQQLFTLGHVEEVIEFGGVPAQHLTYRVMSSPAIKYLLAQYSGSDLLVQVPEELLSRWAQDESAISLEETQPLSEGAKSLTILIEKDFACLNGSEEQNVDTFPNPLQGEAC